MIFTVKEQNLDVTKKDPHLVYYLLAENKQVGEKVHVHNFMIWMSEREREFIEREGINGKLWNDETHAKFDEYLKSFAKETQLELF